MRMVGVEAILVDIADSSSISSDGNIVCKISSTLNSDGKGGPTSGLE